MVFGLILIKESAAPLADQSWFQAALGIFGPFPPVVPSYWGGLHFHLASRTPVVAFGIVMATAGLVEFEQVLMFVYGVFIGLGFSILAVALQVSGTARQIAVFSAVQTFFPAIILVPLLYIELYLDVPLVKAVLLSTNIGLASEIALAFILWNAFPHRALAAPDWTVRLFSSSGQPAKWSRCQDPGISTTTSLDDAETSLDLAQLEQKRVLSMFSGYLEMARTRPSPAGFASRQGSLMTGSENS